MGILLSNASYYYSKISPMSNMSDPEVGEESWMLARSEEVSMTVV